ncbi:MAG: hypothetical protein JSV17_09805 [Candidatus Aminicenantes bacterium]|nr:MAG: hypothetical protein JSV17_09805 [Candidatus Aminicenantes bacterium]
MPLKNSPRGLPAIFLIFAFFLGFSLFVNLSSIHQGFLFADQATYYAITQSLAQDGDIEYTKKDLIRYEHDFPARPLGLFLKKGKDGKLFYAKSFAYPLFAAPFLKVFGVNGALVFHSLLLLLLLLMGHAYFSVTNPSYISLITVLTFMFASIAGVYFLWISPDFFSLFLVFTILFLWLYKYKIPKTDDKNDRPPSKFQAFFQSDWSDYCAGLLIGIAVFSKPPNIVLLGPIVLYSLTKKKVLKTFLIILCFLGASGIFWGTNYMITGEWNYQGGERKTFYQTYPLEKADITFDSIKTMEMTSDGYAQKHLLPAKFIPYNLFYYFFGRYTGMVWYFFPAFLFFILFLANRKKLCQWLILLAVFAEILIFVVLMPDNYAGGGGALGNRYFLPIYPFFLFLTPIKQKKKNLYLCWIMVAVFIAPILLSPFTHSHYPSTHVKKFPFKALPIEMTLVNNFPTNTNPWAFRQEVGTQPHIGWLHFLDDNFYRRMKESKVESRGFWTRGPFTAEMILKTYYPVKRLDVHLLNNPRMRNEITVQVRRQKKRIVLGTKQRGTLSFSPVKPFKIEALHLYRIKISASKGSTPYYESETSKERRYLGVFFEIDIIPEE